MCTIIGDVHQFIGYCRVPLYPCIHPSPTRTLTHKNPFMWNFHGLFTCWQAYLLFNSSFGKSCYQLVSLSLSYLYPFPINITTYIARQLGGRGHSVVYYNSPQSLLTISSYSLDWQPWGFILDFDLLVLLSWVFKFFNH